MEKIRKSTLLKTKINNYPNSLKMNLQKDSLANSEEDNCIFRLINLKLINHFFFF